MRLLERWLSELSLLQRILDLGCGAGSLRAQLAGWNVTGVDVDPKEMETLERVAEKVEKITIHGGFDSLLNELITLRSERG